MKIFCIIDPTCEHQQALARATQLAVETHHNHRDELRLFCCTYLDEKAMGSYGSRKEAKHEELNRVHDWLGELQKDIEQQQNINVSIETCWNKNWYKAAVEASVRFAADLLVKSSYQHKQGQRLLSPTSDYYLIRYASCPVLLTHNDEHWLNGRILAAVAFDKPDSEHELLNNAIVSEGHQLAHATGSELHLVTVLPQGIALSENPEEGELGELQDRELLGQRYGLPASQVHVCHGDVIDAILDTASTVQCDVLLMGSIARKGLRGALLGNTAEKILDQIPMDVLTLS